MDAMDECIGRPPTMHFSTFYEKYSGVQVVVEMITIELYETVLSTNTYVFAEQSRNVK